MQRTIPFLLGLLCFGLTASAQTTPAPLPQAQPVKEARRPAGTAPKPRTNLTPVFIKDTAAFRRSGRPADAVPNRIRPKQ
ncbi:MAG TPA: hypothetical protein VF630_00805 [Hymenobacter sp.]|jgi:hypothetical protein